MIELKDQMNRTIRLEKFPERIVSLVPSQTELLYELGLGERVVGITKFCIHPEEWFRTKQRVGGTKNLDIAAITALKPDLVIGNKEENSQADIEQLAQLFPVYMSDIYTVEDALAMISDIGALTGKAEAAERFTGQIRAAFDSFPQAGGTVLYLIWARPFMAVGHHTFIGDVIRRFGLTNVLTDPGLRYVELTAGQISDLQPDHIFLSSEPFPFNERHAKEIAAFSGAKIHFTDGELFSWYGSRMLKMKEYFTLLQSRLTNSW